MERGRKDCGWRCGAQGHTADVYFEAKQGRAPVQSVSILHRMRDVKTETLHGVVQEVLPTPDFSIVGRLRHDKDPRIWSVPTNPVFDLCCIGFEFRVHPDDPRAESQIVSAADEWLQHAEAVRHVIWEMLELYAIERRDHQQPLAMRPGEVGEPDDPEQLSAAFTMQRPKQRSPVEGSSTGIHPDDVSFVEPRQRQPGDVHDQPWFLPPLPQKFHNGVPQCLPIAPSILIRGTFRKLQQSATFQDLIQPVVDLNVSFHPNVCFSLRKEDHEIVAGHVLSWAKRMPFPLPFNLYFRVDSSSRIRKNPHFAAIRDSHLQQSADTFAPSKFIENNREGPR